MALKGIALSRQETGKHIIVSKMEHHSILNTARSLEKMGFTVTYLPVDKNGVIAPETLKKAMIDETVLVSIIHASSEVASAPGLEAVTTFSKSEGRSVRGSWT